MKVFVHSAAQSWKDDVALRYSRMVANLEINHAADILRYKTVYSIAYHAIYIRPRFTLYRNSIEIAWTYHHDMAVYLAQLIGANVDITATLAITKAQFKGKVLHVLQEEAA